METEEKSKVQSPLQRKLSAVSQERAQYNLSEEDLSKHTSSKPHQTKINTKALFLGLNYLAIVFIIMLYLPSCQVKSPIGPTADELAKSWSHNKEIKNCVRCHGGKKKAKTGNNYQY